MRDNNSSAAPSQEKRLGSGIAQRIVVRERALLQAKLLEHLHDSPLSQYLTLCGASALHGVYLHQRWVTGLNFQTPEVLSANFVELATALGMSFQRAGSDFLFLDHVAVSKQVSITVSVTAQHGLPKQPDFQRFTISSGRSVPVRASSLCDVLAVTLNNILHDPHPVDFLDAWLCLKAQPDSLHKASETTIAAGTSTGSQRNHKLPAVSSINDLLWKTKRVWPVELEDIILEGKGTTLPTFNQVYKDLMAVVPLPHFVMDDR